MGEFFASFHYLLCGALCELLENYKIITLVHFCGVCDHVSEPNQFLDYECFQQIAMETEMRVQTMAPGIMSNRF